jgi:hypothetical protein
VLLEENMLAPETERLVQLLNSILSEVVDSKDRLTLQAEELRLRAVWEASEHAAEFRQFGEASAVGLDTFAAEFQDVLRFMLVIGYRLRCAELESSGLELESGCHGPTRQTRPATCPTKYHSAASGQVLRVESARTRRRSVYLGLRVNAMARHVRGRISLWWRCFLTWSLKVIRMDTFGEKIYFLYQKRHPHRTEPKYPYLSTPGSLSTGST